MRRSLVLLVAALLVGSALGLASGASLSVTSKDLSAFKTCVLSGYPKATTALDDTYGNQNSSATNYGTGAFLSVQSHSSKNRRAFIRFDLTRCSPAIPSGASVKEAVLRLYVGTTPGAKRTYEFRRISASWTETGLNWSNQPGVAASVTANLTLCDTSCAKGYSTVALTPDVAAFVAGSATNNGWRIADTSEDASSAVETRFWAAENDTASTSPQLVIVYKP